MRSRGALALALAPVLMVATASALARTISGEGVVRSEAKVEIKTRLASPISRIPVREGQTVKAGELLIVMYNDVEKSQLDAAAAEVERAKAAKEDAELRKRTADRELERNSSVEDLITEKDLELSRDAADQAATTLSMRERELTKAEAHLSLAQAVYDGTFIRAPFDGQVTRIYTAVGAMPKPADTVLMDLVALDRLFVEIALPLEYLKLVKPGLKVDVVIEEGNPVNEARVDGKIGFIYPEIDPTIRMVRVKVAIERGKAEILPGMFAKATMEIADTAPGG